MPPAQSASSAAAAAGRAVRGAADDLEAAVDRADLEGDIRQLRRDIEALTRQIASLGEHGYGTARKAAAVGVEQLKSQGEAAVENIRANAADLEAQMVERVREKPITSLAIAAGAGFLFALLSRR